MIEQVAKVFDYVREDYREFTQLSLLYLGVFQGEITLRRPGVIHKARWMAKLICTLKLVLLETQIGNLPHGTITTRHQVPKHRAFATFVTHVYGQWWLTCKETVDAPWNDLLFYQSLLKYKEVDAKVSESAIRALKRHLWYLTEEMVPLALFSQKVPALERQALADALVNVEPPNELRAPNKRMGAGWGKPQFPSFNINASTGLSDFRFLVHDLRSTTGRDFLNLPVSEWGTSDAYIASAENVKAVNVVNDSAERGIKLASDFVESTRNYTYFQNVLQVVEKDKRSPKAA